MIMSRFLNLGLLCLSLVVLWGCSDDSSKPRLLDPRASAPDQIDLDEERLRKQQMQTVRTISSNGSVNDMQIQGSATCCDFDDLIDIACNQPDVVDESCSDTRPESACFFDLCHATKQLCAAHKYLEITGLRSEVTTLEFPDGTRISVPAQSAATNSALSRIATTRTTGAMVTVLEAMREMNSSPEMRACAALPSGGSTYAGRFSATYLESYHLTKTIIEQAVQQTLSVADAELSSTPSLTTGVARAFSARELSRSAAAHWLVGGQPGFVGSELNGLCSAADLTPQARAAIGVFREAANAPDDLTSSLAIEALLVGDATAVPNGSVRARLAEVWNDPGAVTGQALLAPTVDANEFAAHFGLRVDDFVEARRYLSQEIHAFARSSSAVLPARALAGGRVPTFLRYAAVAQEPESPGSTYFTALANYTPFFEGAFPNRHVGGLLGGFGAGLSHFIDGAISEAADMIAATTPQTIPDGPTRDALLTPLALLVTDGQRERLGRFELRLNLPMATATVAYAHGFSAADGLRVVFGEDGLRCATEGAIEGDPNCILDVGHLTIVKMTIDDSPALGFLRSVRGESVVPLLPDLIGKRVYLVRPKPGRSSDGCPRYTNPTERDYCPGDFEALAGTMIRGTTGAQGEIHHVPIVPDADFRAAALLEPNPRWCTRSKESCAGENFDVRLPLEDELSEDNDDIESSWKHYLVLARQAANEADLLGEDVIRLGLEMDLRSEQAQEQLQDVCGAKIDSNVLLNALGSGGGLSDLRTDTQCSAHTDCASLGSAYRCVASRCMRDPLEVVQQDLETTDFNRLSQCIGGDSTIPLVTPGTRFLCVWRDAQDRNSICQGAGNLVCPKPAKVDSPTFAEACPESYFPLPAGLDVETEVVSTTLGYFDNSDGGNPSAPGNLGEVCDAIRTLRAAPGDSALVERIIGSDFFHWRPLKDLARTIGWEARFGGYSAITVNTRPMFSTGDAWPNGEPPSAWPCNAQHASNCAGNPDPDTSLFCSRIACSNETLRAEMNDRMGRAVIAARVTTGGTGSDGFGAFIDLEGVRVPFWWDVSLGGGFFEYSHQLSAVGGRVLISATDALSVGKVGILDEVERDVEIYAVDGPPNLRVAWLKPAAENDRTTAPTVIRTSDGPVTGGRPAAFTIGNLPIVETFQKGDANGFFSGLSSSVLYGQSQPGSAAQSAGHFAWFLGVLKGERAPEQTGKFVRAPLPMPPSSGEWRANPFIRTGLFADYTFSKRSLLDGMELLCEVGRLQGTGLSIDAPPSVNSLADLERAQRYLNLVADDILRRAGTVTFSDLPVRAVDALRQESSSGAYPALGGQYGAQVARLRAALVTLSEVAPLLASEVRGLGTDLNEVRIAFQQTKIADQIAQVKYLSEWFSQVAGCVGSGSAGTNPAGQAVNTTNPFEVLSKCGNMLAQIPLAATLRDLTQDQNRLTEQLALNAFNDKFNNRSTNLQRLATRASEALEELDASLAELDVLRNQGRRALAKALFLDSDQAGQQFAVNTVMRRHFNVARMRYEEAHKNAVRMSFLAKRSIELRLGMKLSDMHDTLPLVAAPSTWESTVCTTTGIDYSKLRSTDDATGSTELENLGKFADAFIGSYVTKLENVVESYRLVHNFHEGTDTAVVSLRDDVQNVRAVCDVPVDNLLFHAGQLDERADQDTGAPGWQLTGCAEMMVDGVTTLVPDCVATTRLNAAAGPFADLIPDLGEVRGYTVAFGPFGVGEVCDPQADPPTCGLRRTSALIQKVQVAGGRYRLSWYGSVTAGATFPASALGAVSVLLDGNPLDPPPTITALIPESDDEWNRYYFEFTAPSEVEVTVSIHPQVPADPQAPVIPQQVNLAALMLEDVTTEVSDADHTPGAFANTGETRTRPLAVCQDTTGETFRTESWRRDCVRLCPDGFSSNCTAASARTYCFRETVFSVNQRDIEAGKILNAASFARGNFNYRVESIGVNLVGTGIRDCSTAQAPSTCFGSGFATYSLQHGGPYVVRNHMGQDFRADLFTGNIEHARGLAAERYLTNPLSSADRTLIGDYLRRELRGRPLDGNFVLRIWEEPGVNFDAIEDVQIVLNYRYWTRFD